MLIRKQVIEHDPEPSVVVVRPRQPIGLIVALGLAALAAIGTAAYWASTWPTETVAVTPTREVIVHRQESGARAQRIAHDRPAPIIVTPPPVLVPPVQRPIIVAPERPVIVEGSSAPAQEPAPKPMPRPLPDEDPAPVDPPQGNSNSDESESTNDR